MLETPIAAFAAACAAVADPDDPFRRFVAALEADNDPPGPYRRLLEHSRDITFRIAPAGTWTRPHSQFEVAVHLAVDMRIVITLPDHFSSPSVAAAHVERGARENIYDVRRLRHVIAIVLDLILLRRLLLMRCILDRFGHLPEWIAFAVSYEDVCNDPEVLVLSRSLGRDNLLLPDPFFFDLNGYERHKLLVLASRTPWRERSDLVVWRGSTTGARFSLDDLLRNERIALAAACAKRPDIFDVKITGVVQTRAGEAEAVAAALEALGLLAPRTSFEHFVDSKFAVHIDGNASAAGFLEKLCLGCCVLRVRSGFEQWYEARLVPWTHYVPIRSDASDIVEKALFLINNPDLAEGIARAGFAFALEMDMQAEAERFVRALAASIEIKRHPCVLRAPPAEADAPEGWHGPEVHPDGRFFRWTDGVEIAWRLDPPGADAGVLSVEIPFVDEIRAGFAAESSVVVGGLRRPVWIDGRCLRAEVPIRSERPLRLVLRTPPPVVPAQAWDADDTRALGLAICL